MVPDQHHQGPGNNADVSFPTMAELGPERGEPSNLGLRTLRDLHISLMHAQVWKLLIYKSGNRKC